MISLKGQRNERQALKTALKVAKNVFFGAFFPSFVVFDPFHSLFPRHRHLKRFNNYQTTHIYKNIERKRSGTTSKTPKHTFSSHFHHFSLFSPLFHPLTSLYFFAAAAFSIAWMHSTRFSPRSITACSASYSSA